MRLLQPTDFGGYAAHPRDFAEAVMAVAQRCGSTGWVCGVGGVHPWEMALMDRRRQNEVWGENPDTWIASPYAAQGVATPTDGGYLLTGRWSSEEITTGEFAAERAGRTDTVYKLPFWAMFPLGVTAAVVGTAEGALAAHLAYQRERVTAMGTEIKDDPYVLYAISEVAAEIAASRTQLLDGRQPPLRPGRRRSADRFRRPFAGAA
ncbi:hypothetical protein [Nocardia sp. NPDC051463]|uniref:hypothetical protein n=1 Tax=Nocardia sp. NPDC051463 TaxID=3154845 RepID=UPI00341EEE06